MKILAVDIGAGTQDVLLYDSDKNLENCFKMVLPAHSLIYADELFKFADSDKKQLLIYGNCIGGGKIKKALKYAGSKKEIFITKEAFRTFTYHGEKSSDFNVKIISDDDANHKIKSAEVDATMKFSESDLGLFKNFPGFGEFDAVCYAVQEHGARENTSNRVYRFGVFKEKLGKFKDFRDLAMTNYDEIENSFYRFKSLFRSLKSQRDNVLLMDTAHCAVLGCMQDEYVKDLNDYLLINFGNGHTTFAIIHDDKVISYMEHHTKCLKDPEKVKNLMRKFADGNVTNEEIYNDGGNGAIIFETIGFDNIKKVVVTGPNRNLIKETGLDYYFASPGGDMMMTGPIGLIASAKKKFADYN
ncbi:MAG: hypothetical protein BWK75_01730 [Candidatus Altiarchaeales archaeon A3]|nr:MAG: hypothetical protein BWK75_01730 [Candidatus Altiarchaeales archaeon A3]